MIAFEKKIEPTSPSEPVEVNRFEQIRQTASDRHKKADTDGKRRRERQTIEDHRLL